MHDFIFNILGDITQIIEDYNYLIIFLLMAVESSFVPFPSEIIMIPAGYLVSKGKLSFSLSLLAGILGSVAGALVNYHLAKSLGYKILLKYGRFVLIPEQRLEQIRDFFQRHGAISTFSGRLIPGIRQYISIPAGLSNMCLKRFMFFTSLGSGIWVLILIIVGLIGGNNEVFIKDNLRLITLLTLSSLVILFFIYRKYNNTKAHL